MSLSPLTALPILILSSTRPKQNPAKRRGGAQARQLIANEDALVDDWRAHLDEISVTQVTLDAEATVAKAPPSTKKGKGKKRASAVREDGLHNSDVEAPKPKGASAKASKSVCITTV